jgi:RES domain
VTPPYEDAAQAVEVGATTVTVYVRHVYIPSSGSPDPFVVKSHDGRWGTDWTLHTANADYVALAEYCRHAAVDIGRSDPTGGVGINAANLSALSGLPVPEPLPARALFQLVYRFDQLADLTTTRAWRALRDAGFDPESFYVDGYTDCQGLASAGVAAGWEALQAPSAAWRPDGACIAIFQTGRPRLIRHRMIANATRPTIAVAYATTYKAGQRPAWLT